MSGGEVHICRPPTTWLRRVALCPTCQRRRRFVGMAQEWYDTIWTCCGCGDAWSDGWRMERPFCRGWRTAKAKARWVDAISVDAYLATRSAPVSGGVDQ